jgi:hypothetical protein
MALPVENPTARRQALAYVIELYDELTEENGAPTLGTQNQAVDFILADPELRRAVAQWAATVDIDEASVAPPRRLRQDELYWRVRAYMEEIMGQPVFASPGQVGH